jgi:DNA mismatch endonuclease, patch repair protein
MDIYSPSKRSDVMSRVRGKNTRPEMLVRRLIHALGYRYVLHSKKISGHPDLAFPGRRKVIFVHGCFWHQHNGCKNSAMPRSRSEYWIPKLRANAERDMRNLNRLQMEGWDALVLWECELKSSDVLEARIVDFLSKMQTSLEKSVQVR